MFSKTELFPVGGEDDEALIPDGVTCTEFYILPSGALGSTSHHVFLPAQELAAASSASLASSFSATLANNPLGTQLNDIEEMVPVDPISTIHVDTESKTEIKRQPVSQEHFFMSYLLIILTD